MGLPMLGRAFDAIGFQVTGAGGLEQVWPLSARAREREQSRDSAKDDRVDQRTERQPGESQSGRCRLQIDPEKQRAHASESDHARE